jgi:glycosyltransferase involved in cell wall biosynthesis
VTRAISLITNNGEVGGGEVMLVALAQAVRNLGLDVQVVVPTEPDASAELARQAGFDVVEIPAGDRRSYLSGLARSRRRLGGDLWWCNGLVPALATAGSRHRRVLHLHQVPHGAHRAAWMVARRGMERTFVPSRSMAAQVPGSTVLTNWTSEITRDVPAPSRDGVVRVGFIGRFSPIKGLDVLARAVQRLDRHFPDPIRLVLAGDARFVSPTDAALVSDELSRVVNVERLGWVSREQFFDAVDLLVVPSVWDEPFGLVAAEAMGAGRPVVVSDAGALPEVVGPDHPWVARAGDPIDTAEVVQRVLQLDPVERTAVCDAARARWEVEYAPKQAERRVATALTDLGLLPQVDVRKLGS